MSGVLKVCHVVPKLPPVREGIGLYAMQLAEEWRKGEGIESSFVVADPPWRPDPAAGTPEGTVTLEARTPEALCRAVSQTGADRVLLHYVGYGYDREGLPFWLVRAAEKLGLPLAVAYHEMWATGPCWKKVFYTFPLQRQISRRLLRHAAAAYTTVGYYDRLLRALQRPGEEKVSGPISGFGLRPGERHAPGTGSLRLLFYGLPSTRLLALRAHRRLLARWNGTGGIATVVLAGRATEDEAEAGELARCGIGPERIERRFDLSEDAIREVLAGADLYLTGYSSCLIGKSTTVLSALAAGCPVLAADGREAAPLRVGVHFFVPDEFKGLAAPPSRARLAEVGEAGRQWWRTEGAPEQIAARIAALVRGAGR